MASNPGTGITETRGPNCARRRPSGNGRIYLVLAAWPLGLDLALRFCSCATHLGSVRERILWAQNFACPAASAQHCSGDGFAALVSRLARRRFQLQLLRRGCWRIKAILLCSVSVLWKQPKSVNPGPSTASFSRAVRYFPAMAHKTNDWGLLADLRIDLAPVS